MPKTTKLILALTVAALSATTPTHGFVGPKYQGSVPPQRYHTKLQDSPPSTIPTLVRLNGATSSSDNEVSSSRSTSSSSSSSSLVGSLNLPLIGRNFANQALIGSTIWTGGIGYQLLQQNAHLGPASVALGLVGLLPLLALSRTIEESESYLASGLNLSTNMAVLRLFGPTPQPIAAFVASAVLAGVTGLAEEVTFRGQLIPVLANRVGDGDVMVGAVLSTLLFAVLHTNLLGFAKGVDATLDNATLLALQVVNGGIFAGLYLATGNLAVPIIAHALYDFYIFYKTHLVDVAGQLEYSAKSESTSTMSPEVEQKWIEERGEAFVQGVKKAFYLMDTNRDGVLSRKELRIALFAYGINLSKMESEQVTNVADLDDSGSIDLDEFIEFVGPTGSTGEAVQNTLYAVA